MEVIFSLKGVKLIKKYNQFYIRFVGGQYAEYPCDLRIKDEEASLIINNNEMIFSVRDAYKGKIPWTQDYFVHSAIFDYMKFECKMSESRINTNIAKFNCHKDIKMEFYETIMMGSFCEHGLIVQGYTAQALHKTTYLSVLGAYNYLIYLREAPINALADLNAGLPRK